MTHSRLLILTALVAVLSTIVFFLPVWGLAVLGLVALAAWMCTIPVWIVQDLRKPRPTRPTVVRHDDGSIEVVEL